MKKYEVIISEQADQDLRDKYEYIAEELLSPDSAAGQLDRLKTAILNLDTVPESHRRYGEEPWRSRILRIFPVDNYIVFYIPDNDELTMTIIRVIYGGRNIEVQLNRFSKYDE